jgi:SpoVK/Ycf46/Vps4 family AAA+-type ATPase
MIGAIRDARARQVWILRDVHLWLRDPTVLRGMRTLERTLQAAKPEEARSMIVLTPSAEVPPELSGHAIVVDWPMPDRAEIAQILDDIVAALPDRIKGGAMVNGKREAAIDAAVGLTAEEASSCYSKSLVLTRTIDPAAVSAEKKRVIARARVLEWHDPDPRGLDAIGGLDNLKQWLTIRKSALSQRARDFGIPAPKGVLLVGVPGCGKSLTAKAIATAWQCPLLRLDLGALRSKWVGESEQNLRKALAVAEAVAPAILWLDEMEKALGGASQGAADGGVSADALGAILSWLQEKAGSVFVVATCNDVTALPPELIRKGRFDEIFWVDLPNPDERRAILSAALKQHRQDPSTIDATEIVELTQAFTGAEVAALVPDALFAAFTEDMRPLKLADLRAAASTVVPLAKTAADKIEKMRSWAAGRARPASREATKQIATGKAGRKLDL